MALLGASDSDPGCDRVRDYRLDAIATSVFSRIRSAMHEYVAIGRRPSWAQSWRRSEYGGSHLGFMQLYRSGCDDGDTVSLFDSLSRSSPYLSIATLP